MRLARRPASALRDFLHSEAAGGVVLMAVCLATMPAYFRGETLPKRHSGDLVLLGVGPNVGEGVVGLRLPDSREATVIAPDLSNLPAGRTAVDPSTGQTYERGPGGEPEG